MTVKKKNGAAGEGTPYTLDQFTQGADGVWRLELEEVPGGYTVTETAANVDGVKLNSVTYQVGNKDAVAGNKAEVTVTKAGTETVAFTNTYDKERDIEISKVDLTNNTELKGASLQITKDNDETFEPIKWISGETKEDQNEDGSAKPHKVKLTAGTYTLSETAAPDGYNIAASITCTSISGERRSYI